ncbi:MAG: HobA domain-containing protein [Campylobacterales bacterium]|nr:HobA domain-containing protein [Campylobacterales bacterium]
MKQFLKWTIDTIRNDEGISNWVEERKYEWLPLVSNLINNLLMGQSIIVITDHDRKWFGQYVLYSINKPEKNRPLLPFYSIESIFPHLDKVKNEDEIQQLNDLLSLSFTNGYLIWYIGKGNTNRAYIAKSRNDSFLWIMDEDLQNSFHFSSVDDLLDIRLIQLFRLFDKSINAAMFNEIDVNQ